MDGTGIGDQVSGYASQVADINARIDKFFRNGAPPEGADKQAYEALRAHRDALAGKAKDVSTRATAAGAAAPDFAGAVRKASAALKAPAEAEPAEKTPLAQAPGAVEPPPSKVAAFREQHPGAYDDLSDEQILDGLYKNHYSDMPREQFDQKMGVAATRPMEAADLPEGAKAIRGDMGAPPPEVDRAGNFEALAALKTKLKAEGKVPEQDPEYRDLLQKQAQGETGNQRGAAGFIAGGAGKGVAGATGSVLERLYKGVESVGKGLTGSTARTALDSVRGKVTGLADAAGGAEASAADAASKRAETLTGQQDQIKTQQPALAEQRAVDKTKPPLPGQPGQEKKAVLTTTQERAAELQRQYEAAGRTTEQAKAAAESHAAQVEDARQAVDALDAELTAQPGMPKQAFGENLHQATEQLRDKYRAIRSKESGYDAALASAGDELRVDTAPVQAVVGDLQKRLRGLTLNPILDKVKQQLVSVEGEVAHDKLSVASADSLRKSIDSIINAKSVGDTAVDSETAYALERVKDALVKALDDGWQPLAEARRKWAELSTPLDIVSRQGALRKVVNVDPLSADAKMAGAQIAGHVIERAREGHPVFSRLVAETPGLRDDARLYFTQDLFGKGEAPTQATLSTWLKANEEPLKQLGLYDEFKSMSLAKQTAQRAVEEAQGAAKQTAAQAKQAAEREGEARDRLGAAAKLRAEAGKRVDKAELAKPLKTDLTEASGKRAEQGVKRLEGRKQEALSTKQKAEQAQRDYQGFVTELNSKVDKQIPGATRNSLKRLYDDGRIDNRVYEELLGEVRKAEDATLRRDALRKKARDILFTATVMSTAGYAGYRAVRAFLD